MDISIHYTKNNQVQISQVSIILYSCEENFETMGQDNA